MEKNKKPSHSKFHWLIIAGLFIISGVFLQVSLVRAYFPVLKPQGAGTTGDCKGDGGVYNAAGALYCACNLDFPISASESLHFVCPPGDEFACSTNNYLTPTDLVYDSKVIYPLYKMACLKKIGQRCGHNASCEAQSVCKESKCILDKGGSMFVGGELGTEARDIRDTLRTIINYALGFLGVLCVIFLIYGGVLWITSAGSSDRVKKGKDTMIWAALGTIIITIAWTITSYVLRVGEIVGK